MGGVQFFLGHDQENDKESESEDDGPDLKQLRHGQQVGKKKKSKERQIAAAKALVKKVRQLKTKLIWLERKKVKCEACQFEFFCHPFVT